LQAIATARRLGAITYGFDVREAAREQVESLGAIFLSPDVELQTQSTPGNYADAQTSEEQNAVRRSLRSHLAVMQLVVTSAQIPGAAAPLLIDRDTLAVMQPGAVIVDLAAESGGNTEVTRADELVTVGGVRVLGPTNMPSAVAGDASRLFGGNVRALIDHLIDRDGRLQLNPDDGITSALLAGQPVTPHTDIPVAQL
jgi:NAD(P) transhydrogenase subunit alpha